MLGTAYGVLEAEIAVAVGRFRGLRSAVVGEGEAASSLAAEPPPPPARSHFREGFATRQRAHFDSWPSFRSLPDLLDTPALPGQAIIVDHVGGHLGVGQYAGKQAETLPVWKKNMQDLAGCSNVVVKLGGLGMTSFGFDFHLREAPPSSQELAAEWKPYIETCIELFGPDRCMFEMQLPGPTSSGAATPSCGTPSSSSPTPPRPRKDRALQRHRGARVQVISLSLAGPRPPARSSLRSADLQSAS